MDRFFAIAGIGRYPMALDDGKRFAWESKGKRPGRYAKPNDKWRYADTVLASIGQGYFQVSPLQAAVFVSAIANGGKVLRPYLVDEVRDSSNQKLLEKTRTEIVDRLPVSKENFALIREAMRRVVAGENAGATKAQARNEGDIKLAGKTGTAEIKYIKLDKNGKNRKDPNGKYVRAKIKNTWFSCFAPYDKPKYVAICLVQGGIYGGTTCAPVVREFFDTWEKTKAPEPVENNLQ